MKWCALSSLVTRDWGTWVDLESCAPSPSADGLTVWFDCGQGIVQVETRKPGAPWSGAQFREDLLATCEDPADWPPFPFDPPVRLLPESAGLVPMLLLAAVIFWLSPAAADPGIVVRGQGEVEFAWTAASGAARYAMEWTDGTAVAIVDDTRARITCPTAGARQLVIRGLSSTGVLGPASVPSRPVLCALNPAYEPDANGDGVVTAGDHPALIQLGLGAELIP